MASLNGQVVSFSSKGCDLFTVIDQQGHRKIVVVETNSCPSGQKSMPLLNALDELGGYRTVVQELFIPKLEKISEKGSLAVIYDKNQMEASGYAAAIAELTGENVLLAEFYDHDTDPPVKWIDDIMHARLDTNEWIPIRAAFKYTTQKPWNRIPLGSKTIVACLAGGRNKLMAARAYTTFNEALESSGIAINTPKTYLNVCKRQIPDLVESMGYYAVVKVPYSNAGQGVYTIINKQELDAFMQKSDTYDKYIVQSLVGDAGWVSPMGPIEWFHSGTIPDQNGNCFVADIRMMVISTPNGFKPVAIYARRARKPLLPCPDEKTSSWEMLGTNLSIKNENGWSTESQRLLMMDQKDFNLLGMGMDDLIEAYVQTCLSLIAIDRMCAKLVKKPDGSKEKKKNQCISLNLDLFRELNPDEALIGEIMQSSRIS